ncbi:LysM domain-containing GPI-anchored protein 1 [Bienertia sinuspersici]
MNKFIICHCSAACASNFPTYASDFGLIVPNGSFAISASHCVQCSCGPGSRNLYCMPATLAVSCSSMQCRGSNLMLGNSTIQQTSAGCNVTSCNYDGYANGTILTTLSSSLQPRCPGPQQFPAVTAPPTTATRGPMYGPASAPALSPLHAGGARVPGSHGTALSPSGSFPSGPTASTAGSVTSGCSLANPSATFSFMVALFVLVAARHGF